ncbi:MAG: hypothetical protein MZV63_31030 [Marinilabiliales bacterium]|nr:hypothetical protein [Marinilabiliales bacterium]
MAFLDLNANGIRDAGEPKASGLNVRAKRRKNRNEVKKIRSYTSSAWNRM